MALTWHLPTPKCVTTKNMAMRTITRGTMRRVDPTACTMRTITQDCRPHYMCNVCDYYPGNNDCSCNQHKKHKITAALAMTHASEWSYLYQHQAKVPKSNPMVGTVAQEVAKKDANNKTSSSPTLDWANKACNTKLCELKDKILTRKHIPRQQFPLEINHFIAYPSLSTRNNSQVPNFEGQFLLKLFI